MLRLKSAALAAVMALTLGLTACDEGDKGTRSESQIRDSSYAQLAKGQPAHGMKYSPTRDSINFWIDTWDEPGKLSYVYLQASNGELLGYYILKGLPVSYCASLTPTYQFVGTPEDGSSVKDQQVPAPSVDGVYYGNSGALCGTYYGRDASTNSYIEYTVGQGQNVLLYERPLPRPDVKPLGYTTIDEARKK